MTKSYRPSQKILEKYANVLVNFALGSGQGIKKGDVVQINVEEIAKPLFVELRKAIWKAGGHVISSYRPSNDEEYNVEEDFFLYAQEHQLTFLAEKYFKGLIDQSDHYIGIISTTDIHALKNIDPKKIMEVGKTTRPIMEWRNTKESAGKFTWTVGLYGTEAMAKEAGMSLKEYWVQIINACFLNEVDPIVKWKSVYISLEEYRKKLTALDAEKYHVVGEDVDLWILQGEKRQWIGGSGRNIPSFELFTSPDWRGTEGWIRFNQPLYRYGNLIEGIELWFEKGVVVKSKATKNENVLKEMIATENANKVGEFSMTDKRFSRITKFMATTLFDENIGGKNGNTHIALGNAYHTCFNGNEAKVTKKQWEKLGFNSSSVHTDIITTTPRTVTAHLHNGKTQVIYKDGQYCL